MGWLVEELFHFEEEKQNLAYNSKILKLFSKEVDKHPPLTSKQEKEITNQIKSLCQTIVQKITSLPPMHPKLEELKTITHNWISKDPGFTQKRKFFRYIKEKIQEIRGEYIAEELEEVMGLMGQVEGLVKELVNGSLRVVLHIVRKSFPYIKASINVEDLIQEGNLGLIEAAYRYDCEKSERFYIYAFWWVKRYICDYLFVRNFGLRYPVRIDSIRTVVMDAYAKLKESLGREPTYEEIAKQANISVDMVIGVFESFQDFVSLFEPTGNGDGKEEDRLLYEVLAVDGCGYELDEKRFLLEQVKMAMRYLKPKEEFVIRMRFGLNESECFTLQELGQRFYKVSRERVRQIESKALEKIKAHIRFSRNRVRGYF